MTELFRPPQGPCYADLRGKAALITGGGAGIGRGITIRLAAEGMHVFICGRRESRLLEMVERVKSNGGQATAIPADLSREEDISQLFSKIREQSDTLDVLVHNAATVGGGSFAKTDFAFWRHVFDTNVHSSFLLARHAAEFMVPRRSGNMIFISTIGAIRAHHEMVAYDSSKGAIQAFARALALELAPQGIRVNVIAPGPIIGQEASSTWHAQRQQIALDTQFYVSSIAQPNVPLGRHGVPAEIGAAVAFLASEQSSYITGHTLVVDGGSIAQIASPRARI